MAEFAVLLMAYGGPSSLGDVEPYLLDVRGGRPTSPELVAEVRHRYEVIGGRSPILPITQAQGAALAGELGVPVYTGMRHWHPYIADAVAQIVADHHRRLVAIVMAPHYSTMSVGAYEKALLKAAGARIDIALVRSWGQHPLFLGVVAAHLTQALQRFPDASAVTVVFTAHSLPRRILAAGDAYPDQLQASAAAVAGKLGLSSWELAYQSAGATSGPWLGPDAGEVLARLAAEGRRNFVIAPIGFVCDHVEILYDVDVAYQAVARRLGVRLERMRSLNEDSMLIACLADLARTEAAQRGWVD
ncbi:MAG TPA: ferrochelatase [Gemmatimonadales bacterium]|nr:ferrochelatase [Gemmatimonadales bacterium]